MSRSARASLVTLAMELLAAAALSQPSGQTTSAPPAPVDRAAEDALVGLWGVEATTGPQVSGALILRPAASGWTLLVGGYEVTGPASGDELRVSLPGGQGELRGRLGGDGAPASAFWLQPASERGWFATPLALARTAPDSWMGTASPLAERLSLYLRIWREAEGGLRGAFHNPDFNWTGRAPWFRVVAREEAIDLVDPATGKTRFVQPYDPDQRHIVMDFGTPIALSPMEPAQAVGYLPRTPAAGYAYRPPAAMDDGWTVTRARDVGLDEGRLQALVERLLAVDPTARDAPRLHSLLVARHGKLVLEEYFQGYGADRPHDLRSASKTVTAIVAGIAMDADPTLTLDTPVASLFGPAPPGGEGAPAITLRHLLTHSSGLACDDYDDASPGNEDVMQGEHRDEDWYRFFLALPVLHPPGTHYAYCSAGVNLALGVVARKTGEWIPELFDRAVGRPLQMGPYHVNLMRDGQAYGGGGMHMRPRDFLKLGQTWLGGGVWNGRRIVSRKWVEASTAHQVSTANGKPGDAGSDGFGWHRFTLSAGGRQHAEYEAAGNGGQLLIVVPDLDLVVATTAGNYGQFPVWSRFRDELVAGYVLAAVRGE